MGWEGGGGAVAGFLTPPSARSHHPMSLLILFLPPIMEEVGAKIMEILGTEAIALALQCPDRG
jgi:hypothetical protein